MVCNGGYKVKLIDFGAAVKVGGGPPVRGGCYSSSFAAPEVSIVVMDCTIDIMFWSLRLIEVSLSCLVLIFGPSCVLLWKW